jgi:alkylhydroperoxidase family enzyme
MTSASLPLNPSARGVCARIPMLLAEDLKPRDRHLLERNLTSWRVLAHSPDGLRQWSAMIAFFLRKSRLDPVLREFALLQIGWLSQEPYEWSHHVKISLDIGITEAEIDQLIAYNRGEKAALQTRCLVIMEATTEFFDLPELPEATVDKLRAIMDLESLCDFMLLVAFYVGTVRLFASMSVPIEAEYLRFLDRFPLSGRARIP